MPSTMPSYAPTQVPTPAPTQGPPLEPTAFGLDDGTLAVAGTLTTQDDCSQESTCKWSTASSACLPS